MNSPSTIPEGFYSRYDDMIVFSSTRLDSMYQSLVQVTLPYAGPDKRQDLLRSKTKPTGTRDYPHDQMVALLLQTLEHDAEVASTYQEVPRQVLTSLGLWPRNVAVPSWIQHGWASFFHTPYGSPWQTGTGPHPLFLPQYEALDKSKKLDPTTELLAIITDAHFRASDEGRNRGAFFKARTLAWSLTYYLAHNKLEGLLRYFGDLSKLPRDLELDEDVQKRVFGRAFELMDSANPNEFHPGKLKQFALDWQRYMKGVSLEGEDLFKQIREQELQYVPAEPTKP